MTASVASPNVPTQFAAENPYAGPRSFKTGESLYGRDRESQDLLDLLIERVTPEKVMTLMGGGGANDKKINWVVIAVSNS